MNPDRRNWAVVAALCVLGVLLAPTPGVSQDYEPLTIVSGDERHEFMVELADTPEARSRGLMYRRSMADDYGMLFDFERVEIVTMWMRNTYIPLDMLFIRADGTIARIAENTEPLSERTISSREPVLSVLEVKGGTTARLGIGPGDRVEHPLFEGR